MNGTGRNVQKCASMEYSILPPIIVCFRTQIFSVFALRTHTLIICALAIGMKGWVIGIRHQFSRQVVKDQELEEAMERKKKRVLGDTGKRKQMSGCAGTRKRRGKKNKKMKERAEEQFPAL